MFKKIKYVVLVLIMISWGFVFGVKAQSPADSLSAYLVIAAKNNPSVMQAFYEYQAALQKVNQAGSLPDPELSIGYFIKPMEQMNGNRISDLGLMQMFPWKGTLKAAKDEMTLMAKAKYESFREAESTVYYNVQSTWYELYKIEKELKITAENIGILQMVEQLALVKFKSAGFGSGVSSNSGTTMQKSSSSGSSSGMAGMGGGSSTTSSMQTKTSMQGGTMGSASSGSGLADLYKIKIAIGDLQNDSALLQSQKTTLIAKFNSLLNRSASSQIQVPDTMQISVLTMPLATVYDRITDQNPMLGMLILEQKSLESRRQMVSKMGYPMIGVGLNYSIISKSEMSTSSMNGKDMIMPMVSVTLPIYRKKYKAMVSETELLNKAKEQEYIATANTLQTQYYEAVQLYQDAGRRMKLYASQYELASKALDIEISSFTASGSDLNDILYTQQQLLSYELKLEEAKVDYNTAIAFLNQLMAYSGTK